MALTAAETARIVAIEKQINKVMTAISNVASTQQVRALNLIKQKELDDLLARVTTLETQVSNLQKSI